MLKYTGYITRPAAASKFEARTLLQLDQHARVIVISFGGGQGTEEIWQSVLHGLATAQPKQVVPASRSRAERDAQNEMHRNRRNSLCPPKRQGQISRSACSERLSLFDLTSWSARDLCVRPTTARNTLTPRFVTSSELHAVRSQKDPLGGFSGEMRFRVMPVTAANRSSS